MSADLHAQLLIDVSEDLRNAGSPRADAFSTCVRRWLDQRCTLDQAFGVSLDGGERHPGTVGALDKRDAALCSAAEKLGSDCVGRLAQMLQRYASGRAWREERQLLVCPAHYHGQVEGDLWAALKAHDRVIGERQIRNILERQRNCRK